MLEELLVFQFVPFFLAAKTVTISKLFAQLTDIIGPHVYGRENSLLEQSVIRLNSIQGMQWHRSFREIFLIVRQTTLMLGEAQSKTTLLLISLFKYLKGFSSFLS